MARSNKTLVLEALDALFGRKDVSVVDTHFAEPYHQHNPLVPSGLAALRGVAGMPGLSARRVRAIAEGDLVVTHSVYTGFGPQPLVAFDVFRVQDGRIVEHWDVMQPVVEKTVSGRSQIDGPTESRDAHETTANKKLVEDFFAKVLYGHDMNAIPQFISTTRYDQHNPGVGDGLAGFGKAMEDLAKAGLSMEYRKTHRIVAEGDLVFTHSEGIFAGRHVAFADLFRVEGGKIVEHWDTIQDVPEKTASGVPMF